MSNITRYNPSLFVEYGYMGTSYSYHLSQYLLSYAPYLGEGGLVDVSFLEGYNSTPSFGLNTSYYLTVAAIPISLFFLGFISILLYTVTACCQSREKCCRSCQCEPKMKVRKGKRIGPLPQSEELKLHFGEEDARYIAAKKREEAQAEKTSVGFQRKRTKVRLIGTSLLCGIFLTPTLVALNYYNVAHVELLDTSSSLARVLASADSAGTLLDIACGNSKRKISEIVDGHSCNSSRIEPLLEDVEEIEVNKNVISTLSDELSTYMDTMDGYLDSAYVGLYRQIFMCLLFLWPLLVLWFMYFNTYKVEGGYCLMGCCMDGTQGVDRTLSMAMGTFWALLSVTAPVLVLALTLADLCHYDDPVAVVNENFISAHNLTDASLNLTSLSMTDVAAYFSTCNGSNPLTSYFEQAQNSSGYLTTQIQGVMRYNETTYDAPPSCNDNDCATCPGHYILQELYNLSVATSDRLLLLQDSLQCSSIMPLYRETIESTLCAEIYNGTAALAISTLFSSFFLFLCLCLLLVIRQHYLWIDRKREDSDYDSDHEGFKRWNMMGHDDSSTDDDELGGDLLDGDGDGGDGGGGGDSGGREDEGADGDGNDSLSGVPGITAEDMRPKQGDVQTEPTPTLLQGKNRPESRAWDSSFLDEEAKEDEEEQEGVDLGDSDEEDAYYNPHAMPKEVHYGIPNSGGIGVNVNPVAGATALYRASTAPILGSERGSGGFGGRAGSYRRDVVSIRGKGVGRGVMDDSFVTPVGEDMTTEGSYLYEGGGEGGGGNRSGFLDLHLFDVDSDAGSVGQRSVEEMVHYEANNPSGYEDDN